MKKYGFVIFLGVFLLLIAIVFMLSDNNTKVLIETNLGNIELELYDNTAPITVENFLRYVDAGFYDGLVFHRVIDGFVIQGGGFDIEGNLKQTSQPIVLESNNGLKNVKGTIAMARTMVPDSATSQFFINLKDNPSLDYSSSNEGYAVFGQVVKGMDVVEMIGKVETSNNRGMNDWPVEEVVIIKITRV